MAGAGDPHEIEHLGKRVDHLFDLVELEGDVVVVAVQDECWDVHVAESLQETFASRERPHDLANVVHGLGTPALHPSVSQRFGRAPSEVGRRGAQQSVLGPSLFGDRVGPCFVGRKTRRVLGPGLRADQDKADHSIRMSERGPQRDRACDARATPDRTLDPQSVEESDLILHHLPQRPFFGAVLRPAVTAQVRGYDPVASRERIHHGVEHRVIHEQTVEEQDRRALSSVLKEKAPSFVRELWQRGLRSA